MGKTIAWEIQGSSNIGLFAYATDSYCLIGKSFTDKDKNTFTRALDVPLIELSIGGSSQIGAYVTGNSQGIVVPSSIRPSEEEVLKKNNIPYFIIQTNETALGNNLVVNDNYFFYHPDFESSAAKQVSEALKIEGEQMDSPEFEVVGAVTAVNKKGGLIQKDIPEETKEYMQEKLKVPLELGTLNFGSPIVKSAIVANSKGMVVGKMSAGIEITNADMAFGFLE